MRHVEGRFPENKLFSAKTLNVVEGSIVAAISGTWPENLFQDRARIQEPPEEMEEISTGKLPLSRLYAMFKKALSTVTSLEDEGAIRKREGTLPSRWLALKSTTIDRIERFSPSGKALEINVVGMVPEMILLARATLRVELAPTVPNKILGSCPLRRFSDAAKITLPRFDKGDKRAGGMEPLRWLPERVTRNEALTPGSMSPVGNIAGGIEPVRLLAYSERVNKRKLAPVRGVRRSRGIDPLKSSFSVNMAVKLCMLESEKGTNKSEGIRPESPLLWAPKANVFKVDDLLANSPDGMTPSGRRFALTSKRTMKGPREVGRAVRSQEWKSKVPIV